MSELDENQIHDRLKRLAQIEPTQEATERAKQRVRDALASDEGRQRRVGLAPPSLIGGLKPTLRFAKLAAADEGMNAKPTDVYGGAYGPARGRVRGSTGYPPTVGPVGSRRVLVVPADQVDPKQLAEMTEDMQVMSYILDERFKETRRIQGVFMDFGDFFGRDNRQTEATYIQGYGVLFAMEVNFSFSPPPKPQAQGTEPPAEPADSTWQRAKQQVFSPRDTRGAEDTGSPEEYNSQMVEELKRDLITTLKHAANIRGLQPDEWVILTVVGGSRQFGGGFGSGMPMMGGTSSMSTGSVYRGFSSGGYGGPGGFGGGVSGGYGGTMGAGMGMSGGGMMGGGMGGSGAMEPSSTTVLTIRAKKFDVDSFAKGELDLAQFQQRVPILLY